MEKITTKSDSRPLVDWDKDIITHISGQLGESPRLEQKRLDAFDRLQATAWPNPFQESWRRTDPREIGTERFKLWDGTEEDVPLSEHPCASGRPSCGSWLDLFNCRKKAFAVAEEHEKLKLRFGTWEEGFNSSGDNELISRYLEMADDDDSPAIHYLHTAFSQGGAFMTVPAYASARRPIWIRNTARTPGGALFPINLFHLATGAQAALVFEQDAYANTDSWLGSTTFVDLEPGASLNMTVINRSSPDVRLYDYLKVNAARDANFTLTWADLTAGWAVIRRETVLQDSGAEVRLRGMHLGSGSSHLDLRTSQSHPAPHTTSDLLYKTAMFDNSMSIYQGLINIGNKAVGADAYQLNRNLLMSADSKADTIPMLEILVDDVRCSHGASVGKIDPEALFYMMSRGLSNPEATQLLVEGFLVETTKDLTEGAIKDYLMSRILNLTRHSLRK